MTFAPTEAKLTIGWFASAPVSSRKFDAVRLRNEPRLIVSWSALKTNALKWPSVVKVNAAETATVSASGPSLIVPLTALPGRNWTPPEETTMPVVPSAPPWNWTPPLSNVKPNCWTPKRMSLKCRRPRRSVPPAGWTIMSACPRKKPSL